MSSTVSKYDDHLRTDHITETTMGMGNHIWDIKQESFRALMKASKSTAIPCHESYL